jgi:hypothetical protein
MAERTEYTGHARLRGCLRPLLVVVVLAIVLLVFLRLSGFGAGLLFPQIVGQNCGVASSGDMTFSRDPEKGELCLWHAYLQCRTATLVFDFQYVDTGSSHAITVKPGTGGCVITDNVQEHGGRILGAGLIVTTYQCTGLHQYAGGLVLTSCGAESNVDLPPPVTPVQVGHLCGTITIVPTATHGAMVSAPATVAGIETCFLHAYTSCTPATLIYGTPGVSPYYVTPGVTPIDGLLPLHTLVVWQPFGTCLLTDALRLNPGPPPLTLSYYDCAGLAPIPGGGLVVRSCGAEGDIRLPPGTPASR